MQWLQKSIIKLSRNIMENKKILRYFFYLAYLLIGLVLMLVFILFLIVTDATLYDGEKHTSPYNKDVSNLFVDCNLVDSKNIILSYQQIMEILKTDRKIKRFIGCQINFDRNGELYSYQFYFDIRRRSRFYGILNVSVGTGLIEEFNRISAYEVYTHFWIALTRPGMFIHKKISDNVLEKRILDINKRINESPNKIRTVYIKYDKTEFRFENMDSSEWDKIEYLNTSCEY